MAVPEEDEGVSLAEVEGVEAAERVEEEGIGVGMREEGERAVKELGIGE
jgi:hypothetical protein